MSDILKIKFELYNMTKIFYILLKSKSSLAQASFEQQSVIWTSDDHDYNRNHKDIMS